MDTGIKQLAYVPSPHGLTRKKVRWLIALLATAILVTVILKYTRVVEVSTLLWGQWRCMNYRDDSRVPVFVFCFEPERMTKLLRESNSIQQIADRTQGLVFRGGRVPIAWRRLVQHPEMREKGNFNQPGLLSLTAEGTIFLGTLRTAKGDIKLVAINVVATEDNAAGVLPGITAHIITPGNLTTAPAPVRQLFHFGPIGDDWRREDLRIYPAHVDPHNESKCEAALSYIVHVLDTSSSPTWHEKSIEKRLICELEDDGRIKLSTGDNKLIPEEPWPETYLVN